MTTPESIDILSKMLDYTPLLRPTAIEAMTHTFFDELRQPDTVLPNGKPLPELFNFTAHGKTRFLISRTLNTTRFDPTASSGAC
jgi:serine/threonine protein kinase